MPATVAERQRSYRQRQRERIAGLSELTVSLEAALSDLRARQAGSVPAAEASVLRRKLDGAEAGLAAAAAAIERLEAEAAGGPVPRCARCHGELACPACYRTGDF